jgi:hypothetical protein
MVKIYPAFYGIRRLLPCFHENPLLDPIDPILTLTSQFITSTLISLNPFLISSSHL